MWADECVLAARVYGFRLQLPQRQQTEQRAMPPQKNIIKLEGKYSLESTDPRESEIRTHLRP